MARNIHGSNENHENILEHVTEVLENSRMKMIMESIQHKATSSTEDTNFFVTYIFLSLTYRNWQPALNLILSEAKEATEKDGKLIIHSASHKTSLTYGPAILVLKGDDTIYFKHCTQNIHILLLHGVCFSHGQGATSPSLQRYDTACAWFANINGD